MTAHSVSNPQTRRVATRRKMQDKWRRSPRWRALLEDHAHTPEAECVYCHRHHGQKWTNSKGQEKTARLTINHTSRHLYASEDLYLTWDPRYMEITCLSCNRQYERGMKPCPECLKNGRIRYILDRDSECWSCYYEKHPEEKRLQQESRERFAGAVRDYNAQQAKKRRDKKTGHPCVSFRIGGVCGKSLIRSRCTFSRTKALKPVPIGCSEAISKKKMVKK
ncbi:MAG: hypothetical protein WCX22_08450 [Methanoregula sp.]